MMSIYAATITLILVMDPLGNIPAFLSVLNSVDHRLHSRIIVRESFFAFAILLAFLFGGEAFLTGLHVSEGALNISGGIILFLIAIKMIFPNHDDVNRERLTGDPFIVPLAIPFIAGPSTIAAVMLLANQQPTRLFDSLVALTIASVVSGIILLFGNILKKLLGQRGLIAMERLMGMVLTTLAVQMFLTGIELHFHL
jgi:multiple antibiotic resistance protein